MRGRVWAKPDHEYLGEFFKRSVQTAVEAVEGAWSEPFQFNPTNRKYISSVGGTESQRTSAPVKFMIVPFTRKMRMFLNVTRTISDDKSNKPSVKVKETGATCHMTRD
jgi:hypothetical protein